MADFKTALEALAKGETSIDVLTKQLAKLLEQSPQYAGRMLSHLDEMYGNKKINDQIYAKLKGQINKYRRAHATQTESGGGQAGDSTVFAQEDAQGANVPPQEDAGEVKTEIATTGVEPDTAAFDVTGGSELSAVDIDISAPDSASISTPSITSGTGPAGTGWSDPSAGQYRPGQEMGPGSVIKQRFKLLEVLGVGGMGKVFKGIDLLKQEARDKNPYVAIKLLNEDFREHPEAFIALQRESSRQQKLAHPNIATVYDFDRIGGPGTPVYITMELMEGMPLNDYIKKDVRKKGGLPFDEAFNIIRQLGAALSYAHERRLVHSDFKPGNAFLCNDGQVKTLDFGIARAVKNPAAGEAEKTLFDPGKLGALTPAYASLEMLEGGEPDTRDDTYALGCVAYELLTGKHPYNKLPANRAKENNLLPPYVKGLKKKQNKALRKSVAYLRKDRPASVDEFIEELEAKFIWYKNPLVVAAILVVVIGIGAVGPVMNFYHKKEIEQFTADIMTGDPNVIENRLAAISAYEKADQLTITDAAKKEIQAYFTDKISTLIDISKPDYNFPQADKILEQITLYYAGSSYLLEQRDLIASNKKQQLSKLYAEFSDALQDPSQLDNTKAILETIKLRIDPENPLLTDPRPANQYRILADDAFDQGDYQQALAMVTSGLAIAPTDQQLKDSQSKVERAIRVVTLQEKIGGVQGQLAALADYKQYEGDITELASLNPGDPLLATLSTGLKGNIDQELSRIVSSGSRSEAEALATDYGGLMSALQLGRELSQVKLAHLQGEERAKAIQQIVQVDKKNIDGLLASPKPEDDKWKTQMMANVQELDSLSSEDPSITQDLSGIRSSIANLYIDKANQTLKANRFDAAASLIDSGERFAPGLATLQSARDSIAQAKAEHEKQLLIAGLKQDFTGQIEGNQVIKALEFFDKLKAELPENDPFITTEAPGLLAKSYGTLAKSRFEARDYANAKKLADEGLKHDPQNTSLRQARNEYAAEANIEELAAKFKTALTFDTDEVMAKLGEIETAAPSKYSKFRQDSINLFQQRIETLRGKDENSAVTLAQSASAIFRGTILEKLKEELKPKPWAEGALARAALNGGKLTEATTIQQAAAAEFTGHPEYVAFSEELAAKKQEALNAFEQYQEEKEVAEEDYEKLQAAKKQLIRAQAIWIDNPDYDAAVEEIDTLIAANKPAAKKIIQRETVDIEATIAKAEPGTATVTKKEWKPISSGRECNTKLAGYGKRAKAICYDLVNDGWRGPLMVVVPTGGEFQSSFAIGKYEVSVGDWSKYCALTGRCKPETNKEKFDEPVTSVSLKEAEEYAKWLSERTGKSYRLPTSAEWIYAANAAGNKGMKKDFNCRVSIGEKLIKGTGTVAVTTGVSNDWGLKNFIGNVQEWVLDGGSVKARGGAYEDAHSKCDTSLERSHSGGADEATGFRLVLEEVG